MQISASEIARLPIMNKARIAKLGKESFKFDAIKPDSLPKTAEPDSAEVNRVLGIIHEMSDTRDEVISCLKDKISSGKYEVDGESIAEMMVRRMEADQIR
ncbi:MAG: flagellar biosynthesis anti-sigma factor FlgM [Armatimonadota bacterium]